MSTWPKKAAMVFGVYCRRLATVFPKVRINMLPVNVVGCFLLARWDCTITATFQNVYCDSLIVEKQMWLNFFFFFTKPFMVLCQEGRAGALDEELGDPATALRPND